MRQLTVTLDIDDQFLADILTTAMEGGVGYWLLVGKVHRADMADEANGGLSYLSIYQADDPRDYGDDKQWKFSLDLFEPGFEVNRDHDITLNHVFRGLERLFEHGVLPNRGDIREAIRVRDGGSIDADAADVIVQLGFFGEVVFG